MKPIPPFLRPIVISLALSFTTGCTRQERVKQYGGTMTEDLPAGQKFVTVTWEQTHLWIATRPALPGEQPTRITVHESSNFGIYQGTIYIQEH